MTREHRSDSKELIWHFWQSLNLTKPPAHAGLIRRYLAEDVRWHGPAPIDKLCGREAVLERYWRPLIRSFQGLVRDCHLMLGGEWDKRQWVSATGYFRGKFVNEWLGIPPSRRQTNIRFGEFCAVSQGQIVESYLGLDILDVMRQAGQAVFGGYGGIMGEIPPPPHTERLSLNRGDAKESEQSVRLIEAMIAGLRNYDGANIESMSSGTFKARNYLWYGPCGVGTAQGLEEFEKYHQEPFLLAFPDRKGGNHKARFGDGRYACCTGWPSVTATHSHSYLGVPATHRKVTMRVMDWFTRDGPLLTENRVWIDLVDLLRQLGVNVLADSKAGDG